MTCKISSFVAGIIFLAFSLATDAEPLTDPYEHLTAAQRVGQVFIWTYAGTSFSPSIQSWLEKYQPGALIAFSRNIKTPAQIAKLNAETQKFALSKLKTPLFLMIDQEGGTVTRLKTSVPMPSALALGQMADVEFIRRYGKANATLLHDIGFNVNLAPVLDLSNPERGTFIGNRAFGDDPETVAKIAAAYAEGLNLGGLIPTAKHFPGHGGVVQDSHHTTPQKLSNYQELADKDWVPFEEYAQAEYPRALMMAHLALPNIDPSGEPSTYSHVLIQDFLRGKLKYDGLVITDDLEMAGASADMDIGERAVRAFLAGNDMLMLAGSPAHQKKAYTAMLKAVKSGRIPVARLKESVTRILSYKDKMKIGAFKFNSEKVKVSVARLEKLSRRVLQRNLQKSVEGQTARWPEIKSDTQVLLLSSDRRFYESFMTSFRDHGKSKFFQLAPQTLNSVVAELAKPEYQVAIYYATGTQTAHWLEHLPPELRAKTIVVNANQSGDVENQNSFLSVLNINTLNFESGAALGDALISHEMRMPASEPDDTEDY